MTVVDSFQRKVKSFRGKFYSVDESHIYLKLKQKSQKIRVVFFGYFYKKFLKNVFGYFDMEQAMLLYIQCYEKNLLFQAKCII